MSGVSGNDPAETVAPSNGVTGQQAATATAIVVGTAAVAAAATDKPVRTWILDKIREKLKHKFTTKRGIYHEATNPITKKTLLGSILLPGHGEPPDGPPDPFEVADAHKDKLKHFLYLGPALTVTERDLISYETFGYVYSPAEIAYLSKQLGIMPIRITSAGADP